jgi:hypothetical protein
VNNLTYYSRETMTHLLYIETVSRMDELSMQHPTGTVVSEFSYLDALKTELEKEMGSP